MRNPLKKITKKINLRLANNAAQHSAKAAPQKLESSPDKLSRKEADESSRTIGLSDHVNEDPLFNNRSSRLRQALAESKKNQNKKNSPTSADNTTTGTPKKKKKSRLSFGGSRKTNPEKGQTEKQEASRTPSKRSSFGSSNNINKQQMPPPPPPLTPPREGYVYADEAGAVATPKKSLATIDTEVLVTPKKAHAKFDSPTVASQQKMREKAPVTAAPPKLDPNLERIARAAAALDNSGNELFERGEYDKAMANYVKALKLKNRTLAGSQQMDERGNPLVDVPMSAAQAKAAPPAATANAPQPSSPTDKTPENDLWVSVATSINNIGYLRQQSGQASAEETMQAYQNSLQIKRRVLGKDNLSVGKTLNNLGTVHYLKREYEQALEAYGEALQIMMATLGPGHLDVGTVHSNMGDVFWAQSGDTNFGGKNDPQRNYQNSRTMALRHYRRSLEIRWEELQDHRDPKIIRLLEKIAALEMGESFLAMVQNSHKHRLSPKGSREKETTVESPMEPDEEVEAEQVKQELQTLHMEVRKDVKAVDMMERKMAIDMVKDKLRLVREMKKLSNLSNLNLYELSDDETSIASGARTPPRVQPLSPVQRTEALSAVKERLQQLRESRSEEPDVMRRHTVATTSDLKEADCSPTHFFMSQRASQLLNRTFLKPSPDNNGLDGIRKLSFHGPDNDLDAVSHDGSEISDITRSSLSVSRRATHALEEGIDALRSHNVKARTAGEITRNPWMIASTMASPEKSLSPPETPLAVESMGAF